MNRIRRAGLPGARCAAVFAAAFAAMILAAHGPARAAQEEGDGAEAGGHGRRPIPSRAEIARLPPDGGPDYNRLVFEQSPYLLQHAGNPVNWYAWGPDAFEAARREDKPIFLSIGYSTCHWCHVMERESFEDDEIGRLMNETFIAIKVDREERPDIDQIYMTVTQAMTGSGGWPMTVIMTPDKKPFFTGTYFPREGRFGRPGMLELIPGIGKAWAERRAELEKSAEDITAHVARMAGSGSPGAALGPDSLDRAYTELRSIYDPIQGGFGAAPKFPQPANLLFLLRYAHRSGKPEPLDMVTRTLTKMRLGGMYDHVGFGFHRYSTDERWLLPHFEKMLYDQALLSRVYTEAWQATGDPLMRQTAEEIFTYVLRDMTSPEGGFYSAEDADSEGEEGKFYVWTPEEVASILGEDDGGFFTELFQFAEGGNFRDQSTRKKTGDNIPHLDKRPVEIAESRGVTPEKFAARIEAARAKLFEVREARIHPLKDDKILTDWNGLMIAALAKAGAAMDEPRYRDAARHAADFILAALRDSEGRLLHRYRQGSAGLPAHLEDYAYFTWGLIELYQATYEPRYLRAAVELTDQMIEHFWDDAAGGFFQTADDGEVLFARVKNISGGARPAGNAVAVLDLLTLARLTGRTDYETRAEDVVKAFSGGVASRPSGSAFLMAALDFAFGQTFEIVITGEAGAEDTAAMLRALQRPFLPGKVVLFKPAGGAGKGTAGAEDARAGESGSAEDTGAGNAGSAEDTGTRDAVSEEDAGKAQISRRSDLAELAPFTADLKAIDGKATAYVCRNFACSAPTTDIEKMLDLIRAPGGAGAAAGPSKLDDSLSLLKIEPAPE